jgi:hypothetical protein
MNELTEYPMFGTGELILMFSINFTISVLFGVGLAYLCKILFRNYPRVVALMRLMPWRGITALSIFVFTPSVIGAMFSMNSFGQLMREILLPGGFDLERLALVCIVYQISFLAAAWTAAVLVSLWVQSSPLSRLISALRSFVVVGIFIMLNAQLFSGNFGLAGSFYYNAMMYDTDAALAAFGQIVWVLICVDLLLGLIQLLVNWKVARQKVPNNL